MYATKLLNLDCGVKKFANTYIRVSLEIDNHHFLSVREQYLLQWGEALIQLVKAYHQQNENESI